MEECQTLAGLDLGLAMGFTAGTGVLELKVSSDIMVISNCSFFSLSSGVVDPVIPRRLASA